MDLNNIEPVDLLSAANRPWAEKLQGNILNGHGRDFTANLFLRLPQDAGEAWAVVRGLADQLTSAFKQEQERQRFKHLGIPGDMFRSLLLSASGYRRLGLDEAALTAAFADAAAPPVNTSFLGGAKAAVAELDDPEVAAWEPGFQGDLDALLLLGEDDERHLRRRLGEVIATLPADCVVHIEYGRALRNADDEGIEHFGYVDGRSQPLLTVEDFARKPDGSLDRFLDGHLRESHGGRTDQFDPFAALNLALVPDRLIDDPEAFGSYFVFRKLEQNVRGFKLAEQLLADVLALSGGDRERAGAMAVGRFEDGTPVVSSQTDGMLPAKDNNFTYVGDPDGLKCPFQSHVRKTNPRGETGFDDERDRRLVRRGITFGSRPEHPQEAQDISDLPSSGVGLLFMCFQASIPRQFGFMQKFWANNDGFLRGGAGIDPIIGQGSSAVVQAWRARWGADDPGLPPEQDVSFAMRDFVTMKGGEFFFAPSIPFLKGL